MYRSSVRNLMFLVIVGCSCMDLLLSERTQRATKLCIAVEGTTLMTMVFRLYKEQDRVDAIHVYTGNQDDAQQSTKVTNDACVVSGSGLPDDPYQFMVNVSISDSTVGSECGAYKLTPNVIWRMRLKSIEYEGFENGNDAFYDVICSYSERLRLQRTQFNTLETAATQVVTLQPEKVTTTLEVRDENHNPLTSATLGDKIYLHLRFFSGFIANSNDVYGTEFLIVFPCGPNVATSSKHWLYVGNPSDLDALVTVRNVSTSYTILVSSGDFQYVQLYVDELGDNEKTKDKTVIVSSTEEIYIIAEADNSDSQTKTWFTVHPVDTLGTSYTLVVPTGNLQVDSLFTVLATEDNTNISLTYPSWNNNPLSVPEDLTKLNRHEAFQAAASHPNSINGIRLVANNPVSVLVGMHGVRDTATIFSVEEIPKEETLGKNFILIKHVADCISTDSGGTISVQNTVTMTVTNTLYHFEQNGEEPFGISSTTPLLCGVLVSDSNTDSKLTLIPAIENWSNSYMFSSFLGFQYKITLVITEGSEDDIKVIGRVTVTEGSSLTWTAVQTPNSWTSNYVVATYITQSFEGPTFQIQHLKSTFLAVVETETGEAMTVVPGFRLSVLNPKDGCEQTVGYAGDLVDNDCDGQVDEDLDINQETDDNPLDLRQDPDGTALAVRVRPVSCSARFDQNWDDAASSVHFIDDNGCLSGTIGTPLIPNASFASISNDDVFPKEYSTGMFETVRFVGSPSLHFRCRLEFCYSYNDTKCTTNICNSGGSRRKRSSNTNGVSIESSITVKGNSVRDSNTHTGDVLAAQSCFSMASYVITVTAVFLPLMVTLLMTFVLFRKLWRELDKDRSEK